MQITASSGNDCPNSFIFFTNKGSFHPCKSPLFSWIDLLPNLSSYYHIFLYFSIDSLCIFIYFTQYSFFLHLYFIGILHIFYCVSLFFLLLFFQPYAYITEQKYLLPHCHWMFSVNEMTYTLWILLVALHINNWSSGSILIIAVPAKSAYMRFLSLLA